MSTRPLSLPGANVGQPDFSFRVRRYRGDMPSKGLSIDQNGGFLQKAAFGRDFGSFCRFCPLSARILSAFGFFLAPAVRVLSHLWLLFVRLVRFMALLCPCCPYFVHFCPRFVSVMAHVVPAPRNIRKMSCSVGSTAKIA